MLGFRDEIPLLVKREDARRLAAHALLFEEFLAREVKAGALKLALAPVAKRALLHGHCHQKAFAAMGAVEATLRLVPDLTVETVDSSCCGMAGAFGYGADTFDVSLKMAELSLLPAVRKAEADTLILADGTSCRHQIQDGTGRELRSGARGSPRRQARRGSRRADRRRGHGRCGRSQSRAQCLRREGARS